MKRTTPLLRKTPLRRRQATPQAVRQVADALVVQSVRMVRAGDVLKRRMAPVFVPTLRPVPKPPKAWRSSEYRAFVRQHECAACDTTEGVQAHHHGGDRGVGQKASDARCVPLCARCHRCYHDTGRLPGLEKASKAEIDALLYDVQVDLLDEYFSVGGETAEPA